MSYVIADPCSTSKDHSCVEVCPVDCIHPTSDEPGFEQCVQLYIDPDECIDCGACVPECPVDAIFEAHELPDQWAGASAVNAAYFGGERGAAS